jgi:hypothetical protein
LAEKYKTVEVKMDSQEGQEREAKEGAVGHFVSRVLKKLPGIKPTNLVPPTLPVIDAAAKARRAVEKSVGPLSEGEAQDIGQALGEAVEHAFEQSK